MKFMLDHVVIAVADLAQAVEAYRALGFTVVIGGRHPGRTSHNALVVFADGSYLELIAWESPGPAERWYDEHARHGDGLMDFALVPEDVPRAVQEAGARGLELDGPLDGGRERPDGRQVRWQTGRQKTFDLPFLCGDVTPRALRVPEGEARVHPNGVLGVARVTVAVHDPEISRGRYAALLGPKVGSDGTEVQRDDPSLELPASGLRAAFVPVGRTTILLLSPSSEAKAEPVPLEETLRARLATRGEGPIALVLRGAPGKPAVQLDPAATHGVPLVITP
jgi:catechol 2,3-dioxygenase-like lactoylglutathione lyase family enzyme